MTRANNELVDLDPSDPRYTEPETRAVNIAVVVAPYIQAKLASVTAAVTGGLELTVIGGISELTH